MAFESGFRRRGHMAPLLFVLCHGQLGVSMDAFVGKPHRGKLNPSQVFAAVKRGAQMTVDLQDESMDWWAAFPEPIVVLRERYNILPA
jgi:hypothetical protein